jgi:hypothetical protein
MRVLTNLAIFGFFVAYALATIVSAYAAHGDTNY